MSVVVMDERDQRRAAVRAQAAAIADAPRPPRRFSVPPGTALRPSQRRRSHTRVRPRVRSERRIRLHAPRRLIAAAVLLIQVTLVTLALTLPAFRVHNFSVSGTRLISSQSVLTAAAIPEQSIFTLDVDTIRARVAALPWVASASIETELPASVSIRVTERAPAVRLRQARRDLYVADDGATLPVDLRLTSIWKATPPLLDERVGATLAVDPGLIRVLGLTAQRFPAVFGCGVAAFVIGVDDVLSIWTTTGWHAVLGHASTPEGLGSIPAKLSALGALRAQLDFKHPNFGYVDLENPAGPAVAGSPGLPADVTAASVPLPVPASDTGGGDGSAGSSSSSLRPLPHRPAPAASLAPVVRRRG